MPGSSPSYRSHLATFAVAVLLGGVGRILLVNAPELAEGVPLRLDEAVSLFAAIALGPVWGALTSAIATIGTHTPAPFVWPLEALILGLVVRRGGLPVLVAAGFWIVVGGLAYSGVVPSPDTGAALSLLWAKQIINGTLSAVVAQVAASSETVRRLLGVASARNGAPPIRAQFSRALVPVASIPVILLGLGLGRIYATDLVKEGTTDLELRATTTAARLADQLSAAERDVVTLAGSLSGAPRPLAEVERILQLHHAGTVLRTMAVSDEHGAVVALSSRPEGLVLGVALPSVADRPYFLEPRRTGRPFTSNGFRGRGFVPATRADIVSLSAPYRSASDDFAGVVQGSVGLAQLSAWLERTAGGPGISSVVLDAAGQIIATAGATPVPLLTAGRDLDWVRATSETSTAVSVHRGAAAAGAREERAVTVRRDIPGEQGWQVHVRRPVASMQAPLVPFYAVSAGWLLFCVAVATLIAGRVSRHITHPIEVLARQAEAVGRGDGRPHPALPVTAPAEVQSLHQSLDAMVGRLDDAMAQLDQKVRDRTAELAQAAARHDTIFRVASDGMLILDADRRMVEVNDALCRIVGRSRDELIGTGFRQFEPEVTDEEREARRQAVLQHGFARFESEFVTRGGRRVPVEVVATALPATTGRAYVHVRDISERRQGEAERAELEARLRQAQKLEALGTLAGGIAHDFNNILALIAGNADLAALDLPPGHPARQPIDQIGRATTRAEALIRQILTFSRRRDEQQEIVEVGPVVREAVGMLRSLLPAMIGIDCTIDDDLPLVRGDAVQLQQVVMNLGVNAGHAMRAGGGVLSVRVRRHSRDAATGRPGLHLIVADTGTGMDPQTVERAFEPFFTTKPAGEGTGLGLAVVHGIVTTHGGTIDVASAPERGTTFTVWLPAAEARTVTTPAAPAPSPAAARRARVLVVDDEPGLVTLVCRQLERLGYEPTGCPGPQEALAAIAAAAAPFDVMLSDLAMPTMTGIELARRVRAAHGHTVVVLYSGRVTDDDGQQARAAGVFDVLAKPFTRDQLAAAIARAAAHAAATTAPVA